MRVSIVRVVKNHTEGDMGTAGINELNQAHIRGVFNTVTIEGYFCSRLQHLP
jgi:hypothetical protein